jgi:MYXO-CTERM domain-containing protein
MTRECSAQSRGIFATGLGALGLIGWRRKRKQAA